MRFTHGIFFAIYFSSASIILANTDVEPKSENSNTSRQEITYMAAADEHGRPLTLPKKIFGCSEKVIAVIELENYKIGKHHLSVEWHDPHSQLREHTKYYFHSHNEKARVWAWLSLSRAKGASLLQFVNPSAGLTEFIGEWNVKFKIDDKLIGSDTFEVSC